MNAPSSANSAAPLIQHKHVNNISYQSCSKDNGDCSDNSEKKSGSMQRHHTPDENMCTYSKSSISDFEASKIETLKLLAGVAGNVLEWYDFALYGYFSDVIAHNFFPEQAGDAALIESFAIMGGAFLMRPLGGIMIGYIGDKFGSQRALEVSIFIMAFPTFAMGCLPTYSQIGILSPLLLMVVRLLQGISAGGQLMSSLVFTLEHKPQERWGFFGSLVMAVANIGTLLGGLVGYITRALLNDAQLLSWGWRVPFLSGIFLSACGFYLRDHSGDMHSTIKTHENPLKEAFRPANRRALVSCSLVPMVWAGGFYMTYIWLPIFMNDLIDHPIPGVFGVNTMSLFVAEVLLFPIGGILADKYGTKNVMTVGASLIFLFGPLLIIEVSQGKEVTALWAQTAMGLMLAIWGAPMMRWLFEVFPADVRLTSVSIGYNIALALGGGFSPGLATYVTGRFGEHYPGLLLPVFAILGIIGLYIAPHKEEELPCNSGGGKVDDEGRKHSIHTSCNDDTVQKV